MAPAFIYNTILVWRGHKVSSASFQDLEALKIAKQTEGNMAIVSLISEKKHKIEEKKKVGLLDSDHYAWSKYNAVFTQSI